MRPRWLGAVAVSVMAVVMSSCSQSSSEFGIELSDVQATSTPAGIRVSAQHDVRLSNEARSALRNGVPLRVRVDLALRKSGRWTTTWDDSISFEIRYLPLSERYQLSGPADDDQPRTFPRLRHVIAELDDIEWRIEDIAAEPGAYDIRVRSQLDRTGMPGPMQLPMLFSPLWAHDSGWVSQTFEIEG